MIAERKWRVCFLASIAGLLLGAMSLMGIGWVKVKMLPFDNKSEFRSSSICRRQRAGKHGAVRA